MKKRYILLIVIALFVASLWGLVHTLDRDTSGPVVGRGDGQGPIQKDDLIIVNAPYNGQVITSPFVVKGQARGSWFFEGSFPVSLVSADGTVIAQGVATAGTDWMTSDYVPFTATLEFSTDVPTDGSHGAYVLLKKDNPSGDPQFDNSLAIQVQW